MIEVILVLNVGSSSVKFALYPKGADDAPPILRGKIAGIGTDPVFTARDGAGFPLPADALFRPDPAAAPDALIAVLLDWLGRRPADIRIAAAGHRVVHGGRDHDGPARITAALMTELEALVPLAPLHQPHNLAAIRAVAVTSPELLQVACFDTSFHRTQDRLAQLFALPRALSEAGVIRYGFHGLSYDHIARILPSHLGERAEDRVIVAHLGNGASMCAMKARRSVATSMGFTALDGLMMGRRCGAIDPGVILYLIDGMRMQSSEVSQLLYNDCGLLGVSGLSNDMHTLEASAAPQAREAIDLFCYRAACELSALATAIEGVDAIVFTAGIGENSAKVRSLICDRLNWLGVALDTEANARNATRISTAASGIQVLVLPTDEECVIAQATRSFGETAM
jgi:acetate kinase